MGVCRAGGVEVETGNPLRFPNVLPLSPLIQRLRWDGASAGSSLNAASIQIPHYDSAAVFEAEEHFNFTFMNEHYGGQEHSGLKPISRSFRLKECELKNTLVPHTFSIEFSWRQKLGQIHSQWLKTKEIGYVRNLDSK